MLITQCSEKVVWRKQTVSEDRARNKRTGMRENRFLYVCTAVGIHIPFEDKMTSQWTSWRSQSRRVEIKPHFVTVIYDLDAAVIHWKTVRYFLGGLKRCWISFKRNLRRNKLIYTWYTYAVLSTPTIPVIVPEPKGFFFIFAGGRKENSQDKYLQPQARSCYPGPSGHYLVSSVRWTVADK